MVTNKKQGRNEICACGSGKKFKKCCGIEKDITLRDILKCFYLLLEGAAEGNLAIPRGPIPFSKELLDKVPADVMGNLIVADVDGSIVLTVKNIKPQSKIIIAKLSTG